MKKILFFVNSMQPAGGVERVIATLANKISDAFVVTILVKDRPESYYDLNSNIELLSLNKPLILNMSSRISRFLEVARSELTLIVKLRKFLKSRSFDCYYLPHPLNAFELHFARGIDAKVIVSEHGGINAYNFIYRGIKRWLYRRAKIYVVPTTADARSYTAAGYNVKYIPHFRPMLPYSRSNLESMTALTVGRLTEAKRQWIMIDLWYELVFNHGIRHWKLRIVGDGNLKDALKQRIECKGLREYIEVLPPARDVEKYYQSASLFLLTSHSEGFGMVLLEAISFGLPCITYDCPSGPRDIIEDGVNGRLVKMDDFPSLVAVTAELLLSPESLRRYGDNAYQSSRRWGDGKILNKWLEVL